MSIPKHVQTLARERGLQISARIGRAGVTESLLDEVSQQLKSRQVVKVKVNRGLFDRQEIQQVWKHLAEGCGAVIVDVRGNVAVFYRV